MSPVLPAVVRTALVLVALVSAAPRAEALPVTHQFTGTLTTITDGSGVTLDLRGVFTMGAPVTLDVTFERDTPPVIQDAYVTAYVNPITNIDFSISSWSGSGAPGSSNATVTNNAPSPGLTLGVNYDQFSWNALGVVAPPLATALIQSMTSTLDDIQGTVFDSGALPSGFSNLSAFDGKTATFLLFDFTQLRSGYVMATLASVSTPAVPSTWGGIKALYR
jgi:hypothetical protein